MFHKHLYLLITGVVTFFLIAVFSASAQQNTSQNITQPAYYRVAGVASNDVLNVRQGAGSSFPTIGSLAPNAFPVEVIKTRDGWAYVAAQEGMGWVSLHFLEQISFAKFANTNLPEGLTCSGTEPFWSLVMAGDKLTYSAMDQGAKTYSLVESGQMQNLGGTTSFVIGQNNSRPLTGIVSNQICSDGMSEIDYARRIDLLLSGAGAGGTSGYSGCCHIPVQQ